jgi:sarcosine oxidase
MRARFPRLRVPEEHVGFYDPLGAYLFVEQCVQAHLDAAAGLGARLLFNEPVLEWEANEEEVEGVVVKTAHREIHAAKLIVTAGPWAGAMLRDLGVPLTVLRKVQVWFKCDEPEVYRAPEFPIYLIDRPYGVIYGFPDYGGPGLKMAEHTGGRVVSDPATVDRVVRDEDLAVLRQFIADCLPGLAPEAVKHSVCMYTCTPDLHFVLDTHPAHPQVAIACGFSGHGFKFASVAGEIMADLALDGRTALPIGFLRCSRPFIA